MLALVWDRTVPSTKTEVLKYYAEMLKGNLYNIKRNVATRVMHELVRESEPRADFAACCVCGRVYTVKSVGNPRAASDMF